MSSGMLELTYQQYHPFIFLSYLKLKLMNFIMEYLSKLDFQNGNDQGHLVQNLVEDQIGSKFKVQGPFGAFNHIKELLEYQKWRFQPEIPFEKIWQCPTFILSPLSTNIF